MHPPNASRPGSAPKLVCQLPTTQSGLTGWSRPARQPGSDESVKPSVSATESTRPTVYVLAFANGS